MRFYAVHKGRIPGVYKDWKSCEEQVNKFSGADFKKFPTEKQAKDYVLNGKSISTKLNSSRNVTHKNKIKSISKINLCNCLRRKISRDQ